MFWKMNHQSSAQIDTILCKDDLTLAEVLEQECLLQEVVTQNKKLIDFLLRADIMEELVTLITTEPTTDLPEKERYKQAHIACELLTSDMPVFNERLASDQIILSKLYAFLQNEHPLNPLLASFFSRTLGVLIARTSEQHWYSYQYSCLQVIEFLKSQQDCIDLFLKHLSTSAIMDLLLKLVTNIEGQEIKNNVFTWLEEKQLIRLVCSKLGPENSPDDHDNAAQILTRIIDSLRKDDDASVLLATTESEETIRYLLELGFSPGPCSESGVISCVEIVLQLLDVNNNNNEVNKEPGPELKYSGEDLSSTEQQVTPETVLSPVVDKIISIVLDFMPVLHEILTNPPPAAPIVLNSGIIDPPLGFTRLSIIKLLRTLLATQDPRIHGACVAHSTFSILMDLFVQYPGNNFLHTEVEKCLNFVLSESNMNREPLPNIVLEIFNKTRLTSRLLAAYRSNEELEGQTSENMSRRHSRKGYMGHLFSVSNLVAARMCPLVEELMRSSDLWSPWEEFVAGPLSQTNELHAQCLGGLHPNLSSTETQDVPFSSEDQQVFTTNDFVASKACTNSDSQIENEADFSSNLIDSVRSQFSNDDITFNRNEELFLKLCDDKSNDATGIKYNNGHTVPHYWDNKWNDLDSSSDEEEEPPVNTVASSLSYLSLSNNPADPWSSASLTNGEQEGWADFDAAFSSFDVEASGPDNGLPVELTSTTASASQQPDEVNTNTTMSTSISNGIEDHEVPDELEEDGDSEKQEEIQASNECDEESNSSRVNINEIHVIIDEERERQKTSPLGQTPSVKLQASNSPSTSPEPPSTQVTAVATIETTPPESSPANESS